jgi:hypothetical protein
VQSSKLYHLGFCSPVARNTPANELWPAGIHVAIVVLDGVVDLPKTREMMPDKSDAFFIKPKDVAESGFWLSSQARSAWSFTVEARPFGETW